MVKVSNKTRYAFGTAGKIILSILISFIFIVAFALTMYKPVYGVYLKGEFKGYVSSKNGLQRDLEYFMQEGDSEKIAYVILNDKPEYEFSLVKRDVPTKDEDVLKIVKASCDIYYRTYAINVDDKEYGIVSSLAEAQKLVDEVNEKQEKFTKKATVVIEEKYEKEYNPIEDIELAVADIVAPLKKADDEAKAAAQKRANSYNYYTTRDYAYKTTVPQEVLDALQNSNHVLDFTAPLSSYVVTSRYGWRRSGFHTGIDFAAPTGTPIQAIEDGVVVHAAWTGNYGYLVKVQHAGGVQTYYAHCSRFACNVGAAVNKGDVIAYVGSTGNSTGPHCHLEIRYSGQTVDPFTLIDE